MSVAILEQPNTKQLYTGSLTFEGFPGSAVVQSPFQSYYETGLELGATGAVGATGIPALYRQIDRSYIMTVAGIGATGSGATGTIVLSPALPTNLWPASPFANAIWIEDGGVYSMGNCSIGSNGVMTIYKGYNGNFTATGQCGFPTFSVSFASYIT